MGGGPVISEGGLILRHYSEVVGLGRTILGGSIFIVTVPLKLVNVAYQDGGIATVAMMQ